MRNYNTSSVWFTLTFSIILIFSNRVFSQQSKLDSLKTVFENESVDSMRYVIAAKIIILEREKDALKALEFSNQILSEVSIKSATWSYCNLSYVKMLVLYRLGKYDEALELSEEIEKIAASNNYKDIQLRVNTQRGLCYQQQSAFKKAADAYYKANNAAQQLNDINAQIITLNNLSNIYITIKEFEKAKEILFQVLKLSRDHNMEKNTGMVLTNLGHLESEKKNLSTARIYFEEALEIFKKIQLKYGVALLMNNLGYLEYQARDYDLALDYYDKAEVIHKEIANNFGLLSVFVNKTNVYKELANWSEALKYNKLAIRLSEDISNPEKLEEALKSLIEIYDRTGEYNEAYKVQKRLLTLKDSLYEADVKTNLENKKKSIDSTYYRRQIDNLKTQQDRFKINSYVVIITLVLLLIGTSFLGIKYRKRMSKREYESEPVLEELSDAIRIKKLRESLKSGPLDGKFWIEFGLIFDEIHPDFLKKLDKAHPTLTKSEFRLCCLIRLGLHNHDLMQCLNITSKSVRNARYRIYKKMELDSDKEMVSYILSI